MGAFDVIYCPNVDCRYNKSLKKEKDQICPKCGTKGQPFGYREANELFKSKIKSAQIEKGDQTPVVSGKSLLVSDDMTNEEIKNWILQDMRNLQSHEAGSAWMRVGTLLSNNSTDQILGPGLKALIDQNKIIIRQNELILRAIQKNKFDPTSELSQ